jgi:branched-chain amino acid aminotransferase
MTFLAKNIHTTLNKNIKYVDFSNLGFGKYFSQHMLEIYWCKTTGWSNPHITQNKPLLIDPACSSLNYAISCFEGMKAYKNKNNEVLLFRPNCNAERFLKSAHRCCLPEFCPNELVKCIKKLIEIDSIYVPTEFGSSLYIRPLLFSIDPSFAVVAPTIAKLIVITSPVSSYFTGKSITLGVEHKNKRAWVGGTGNHKMSSNYAPTIRPRLEAQKKGYDEILWIGDNNEITEVGTMNIMCVWINKKGKKELITPPLNNGIILPGITRDSVLKLSKQNKNLIVSEKPIYLQDIILAVKEKRMIEMFGTGTAAVITPIGKICYNKKIINVGNNHNYSQQIYKQLTDIQYGIVNNEWSEKII